MLKQSPLIFILCSLMLTVAACSASRTVQATDADNGSTVELHPGDTLVITLEGNPTTGYQWELIPSQDGVMPLQDEPEYVAGNTKLVGSGGVYHFTFRAENYGSTRIDLKYYRSFEPADTPPISTYTLNILVD
jgi:inhibitor of cysteine peptidase